MHRQALALLLVIGGCARAPLILPHQPRERATLFSQVRVFDGKQDALWPPTDVLVVDGRITQISPVIPAPAGAAVVKGEGLVLMPGLFDAHVHLGGVEG